jgi:hypothetical protein
MDQATAPTVSANILHCALELSKKSWLLAIQFPDREQPSLYPIAGGEAPLLLRCTALNSKPSLTVARFCPPAPRPCDPLPAQRYAEFQGFWRQHAFCLATRSRPKGVIKHLSAATVIDEHYRHYTIALSAEPRCVKPGALYGSQGF